MALCPIILAKTEKLAFIGVKEGGVPYQSMNSFTGEMFCVCPNLSDEYIEQALR